MQPSWLDAKDNLMLGTCWRQVNHIKTKIPIAAMLVKHTNDPVWHNFFFSTIAVVTKLLFFDCDGIFNKMPVLQTC